MARQTAGQAAEAVMAEVREMFRTLEARPVPQQLLALLDDLEAQDERVALEAALPRAVGF